MDAASPIFLRDYGQFVPPGHRLVFSLVSNFVNRNNFFSEQSRLFISIISMGNSNSFTVVFL